ncbi:hypothetical protein QCA50_000858 [Cerrena zonata]|uniref:Uncharacterized protein n=1 Tax=Cerrena zonata TaxID=2478898 RepID=A0AAW0H074_9APHY
MSGQSEIPQVPERDQYGGDELPTYDDLAEQNGPNSRFGRWRGWIEKRAAERYADLTPDALARRRQKGWGNEPERRPQPGGSTGASSSGAPVAPPLDLAFQLHIQTDFANPSLPIATPTNKHLPPTPSVGESLSPTHCQVHNFGSRFLPHSTAPIRCLLPILGNRLLLIGHDDGLSVMDMFPREWGEHGLVEKGPNDAEARPIWVGEGVFQMSFLELESVGDGTPQGVVLALVGPDSNSPKDQECVRSLRMYNLASLVSVAKWAISQKGNKPLSIHHHPASGKPTQTTPKKHRNRPSLAKGLRNFIAESPITPASTTSSRMNLLYADSPLEPPPSIYGGGMYRSNSNESTSTVDSTWDVVEELPLRWATDYVPLANPGSRLQNCSVYSYALWRDENQRSRGGAYLAIVIKSNILLYETPKGERSFRYVKEFYTPLQARSLTFVQQFVQDPISRSTSDAAPRMSPHHSRHSKHLSVSLKPTQYPPQLSLFVIFEKKAGMIRIADAAVGEVDLGDENNLHHLLSPLGGAVARRSRASWDGKSFHKESKANWTLPTKFVVPGLGREKGLYILTRGKQSHIYPHPLPAHISVTPAYRTFSWSFSPSYVCPRVCCPQADGPSFLQVMAFGEDGVEVLEVPLSSLTENKGKGKAQEPLQAQTDLGGDAGFLCLGGQWDRTAQPMLTRSDSVMSTDMDDDDETLANRAMTLRGEEGVYGWVRRGVEDWRIFWVGGGHS